MTANFSHKLRIQPNQRLLILNAPDGYVASLVGLPEGVEITEIAEGVYDFVHLFATNSAEFNAFAPAALAALKPDALFWISYPKGSSGVETDLNRDVGWEIITQAGYRGVTQIAIDDIWSAVRFRRTAYTLTMAVIDEQYAGKKTDLKPIYDALVEIVQAFGEDVELAPRKTYVSFVRGKQFALAQPSTATRLDLALKLKGWPTTERLQEAGNTGSGSMTHKVALTSVEDVDDEVVGWLKEAYEAVG